MAVTFKAEVDIGGKVEKIETFLLSSKEENTTEIQARKDFELFLDEKYGEYHWAIVNWDVKVSTESKGENTAEIDFKIKTRRTISALLKIFEKTPSTENYVELERVLIFAEFIGLITAKDKYFYRDSALKSFLSR